MIDLVRSVSSKRKLGALVTEKLALELLTSKYHDKHFILFILHRKMEKCLLFLCHPLRSFCRKNNNAF